MFLNLQTIANLEILLNLKTNNTEDTLFSLLKVNNLYNKFYKFYKTPMGQRRLRTSLLQPLTGITTIKFKIFQQ
jgi:DNA mismatch repair ATPase MutS